MLVVLPVCEKDEHLALKNLELCRHLDNRCEFDCLVSYESGFDPTKVVTAAEQYFQKVKKFQYSNCPYGSEWPRPQNWAWQQTAKYIQGAGKCTCWFWWEADAVPLKAGWLSLLRDAWTAGEKPFAGFVQNGAEYTYMAGVGIYPKQVSKFLINALTVRSAPWDIVAGHLDHALSKTTDISNLIRHDYQEDGGGYHFNNLNDVSRVCGKTTAIYHRCEDESLQNILLNHTGDLPDEEIPIWLGEKRKQKYGIFLYLPPTRSSAVDSFIKNIQANPPFYPIYAFSNGVWDNTVLVEDPEKVVGKDPRLIGQWTWYQAIQLAKKLELEHFMMLEVDCRVSISRWDRPFFKEVAQPGVLQVGGLNVAEPANIKEPRAKAFYNQLRKRYNEKQTNGQYKRWPIVWQGNCGDGSVMWVNGAFGTHDADFIMWQYGEKPLSYFLESKQAWDYDIGRDICKTCTTREAFDKIKHVPGCVSTAGDVFSIDEAVAVTGKSLKVVHPVKTAWRPPSSGKAVFYHSGDLGDIIYALAAIRKYGGGKLCLGSFNSIEPYRNREPLSKRAVEQLIPLLEPQPYLDGVTFVNGQTVRADFRFEEFRCFWSDAQLRKERQISTLLHANLHYLGLGDLFDPAEEPWLQVEGEKKLAPIIVSRSFRYRANFPWQELVNRHRKNMLFVGLVDEYGDFCRTYGRIPHHQVSDFLELAQIIKGAKWFIGNQSFPLALAIAMGVPSYQEYFPENPDCKLQRKEMKSQDDPVSIITV